MSGTLIVAIVALAVSTASLTWQVAQFLLSGSSYQQEPPEDALTSVGEWRVVRQRRGIEHD